MDGLDTHSEAARPVATKSVRCPHTQGPSAYLAKLDWLEWMSKRFKQIKCDKCGLWAVWKRER